MATISGATNEKIYSVKSWGGLNESPDGDTRLKLGEASKMINWKITRDGNLKRRPGTAFVAGLDAAYTAETNVVPSTIGVFTEDDVLEIYSSVGTTTGKIELIGSGGSISFGAINAYNATINNGTFAYNDVGIATISEGTFSILGSYEKMTVGTVQEYLQAHPGTYLYLWHDELPYALNENSFITAYGKLTLQGYLVYAKPTNPAPITGLWSGLVRGEEMLLAVCNGTLWSLYNADTGRYIREPKHVGLNANGRVSFIPFGGDVYILDGEDYYCFDGENCESVDGYIPVVAKEIGPASTSGRATADFVNRLTPRRKVWLSPDGEHDEFLLPEQNIVWDDGCYVKFLGDGTTLVEGQGEDYLVDTTAGKITFTLKDEHDNPIHPAESTNSYEVCYRAMSDEDYSFMRQQVTGNRFAELFSGPTDNMVFIYGDGTNRALYSGMTEEGMPTAEYFPDQYEVHVGDSNTPLTAMVRHYGDLVCYKSDSAWAITQSSMELASGDSTIAIYCTPVNRDKGNAAPGQVRLVDNNPVTCSERELYHWINSSYYTSTLSRDERQARRISDRIQSSIKEIDLTNCCMWDDNDGQEFYLSENKVTLVWNYAQDVWYRYEGIDAVCMCNFHGEVIYGTSDGQIARLTYDSKGDMGYPVKAEWVSGAVDFGASNMRKYSSSLWIGLKREEGTSVNVKLVTDRKDTFKDKEVPSTKAKADGQPTIVKVKLKAKKFVFYRLLLSVTDKQPAVTVTDVEFRVRQTGYAK